MRVLILGDIHGRFSLAQMHYNALKQASPGDIDLLIQVGDFGFWPRLEPDNAWPQYFRHRAVFIDGNHEDHDTLRRLGEPNWGNPHGPPPNDWVITMNAWEYKPRGSIEAGILYIGGARSIDRHHRMRGVDWFPEENISYAEQAYVFDQIEAYGPENIHTVVSHDCPASFDVSPACVLTGVELVDGNRKFLEAVRQIVRPDYWFFGHYHKKMEGQVENTRWRCIDMIHNAGYNDYVLIDLPDVPDTNISSTQSEVKTNE